jgi:cytoskeleton protein RodZ
MAITPGEKLRKIREEKKITLEQAAAGTNIRIQYLQAIEEDRLEAMASPVQAHGFIRLYASFLGINPLTSYVDEPVAETNPQPEKKGEDASETPSKTTKPSKKTKSEETGEGKKTGIASKEPQSTDLHENSPSGLIFKEIGIELQKQREALGLSLADIERQTKIREQYLYALENGQVDELPSTVQGRGMLNNYAAFMSLNPESLQNRFAEALQQRRLETAAEEVSPKPQKTFSTYKSPITGWRRYLTPDLLVGGSVFAILFILVIWGAWQVIGTSRQQALPTAGSISSLLVNTDTLPAPTDEVQSNLGTPGISGTAESVNTPSVDLLATITSVSSGPIQVVVVAYQRAYMKIISDGKEVFNGRIVPGNVYSYTGSKKISLITGNAAALQVYYNQQDLGILGVTGQVVSLEFKSKAMVTLTPQFTASPTATQVPTLTQRPTNTPKPSPTVPTPTITPVIPTP